MLGAITMSDKKCISNNIIFVALLLCLISRGIHAQKATLDYLTPVIRTDSSSIYDIEGLRIEAEPASEVSFITGPDFHTFNFVLLGNDSVGLYQGRYPDVPYFSSLAFKSGWQDVKQKYLDKAISNKGHYLKKEGDPTLITDLNDSIIGTITDTLIWELIVMQDRNLWITRPMENRSGPVDILIELMPENERELYHLFGRSHRSEYPEILIDLAKSMK
jgi:hypothetical protein